MIYAFLVGGFADGQRFPIDPFDPPPSIPKRDSQGVLHWYHIDAKSDTTIRYVYSTLDPTKIP